jgi:threonine/homoserine/homoserine lactone efflux protein
MGAVLAASDVAFTAMKLIGAAYLIYLGVTTFLNADRAVLTTTRSTDESRSARSLFLQGWMVGASNPKAILFFSAFFPQFIDAQAAFVPQFSVLAVTFITMEFSVLSLCCVFAARLGPWLRQSGRTRTFNRISGSLFACMGGLLLLVRRPS